MKKAISAQNTRMYLENPDAPAIATGVVKSASRSRPCFVVLDSVANMVNGEPMLITGTAWASLDSKSWIIQNIDRETKSVTLARSDTTEETDETFDTGNARFVVPAFIDVCAVSYSITQNPAATIDTTTLCSTELETMLGLSDPGTVSFDFFIDPTDPDYQELLQAQDDGLERWFLILYRNGAVRSLPVSVQAVNEAGGVDQAVQGACTMKITGKPFLTMPNEVDAEDYLLVCAVTPKSGIVPMEVTLVIDEAGGQASSFFIQWQDGAVDTTSSHVAQHVYDKPGAYTPSVSAMLYGEQTAPFFSQTTATVQPTDAYYAKIDVQPVAGTAPLDVTATITETNGPADFFDIDWKDGSKIERIVTPSAKHTYTGKGTYIVTAAPTIYGMDDEPIAAPPVVVTLGASLITGVVTSDDAKADGVATNGATFTVTDPDGNPVVAALTVKTDSATATVSPVSGTTDSAGKFDVTVRDDVGEQVIVTATTGVVNGTAAVKFIAPPPVLTSIVGTDAPAATPADSTTLASLTFTARDAKGVVMAGIQMNLTSDSQTAALDSATGTTDAAGTVTVKVRNSKAEKVTITATSGAVTGTASAEFSVFVPAVDSLRSTNASGKTLNDGKTKATVKFQAYDAGNTPIDGAAITLKSDRATATLDPAASGHTDDQGYLSVTVTDSVAEIVTVTATSGTASATATAEFAPPGPTVTTIAGSTAPYTTTANGTSAATVSFTVTGSDGKPMADTDLELSTTSTTAVLKPTGTGTTDAAGRLLVTIKDTAIETVSVTATSGGVSGVAKAEFIDGTPVPATIGGNGSLNLIASDGVAQGIFNLFVRDANSNMLPNVKLSLTADSATAMFDANPATTAANGWAVVKVTDTVAETVNLTAKAGNATSPKIAVTFAEVTAITPTNGADALADGKSPSVLSFVAKNSAGTPVGYGMFTFVPDSSTATLDHDSIQADGNGLARVSLTNTRNETVTVRGTCQNVSEDATATFTGAKPQVVGSIVPAEAEATNSASGTAFTASFAVYGPDKKTVVPGVNIGVSISAGSAVLSSGPWVSNSYGYITPGVSDTVAEDITITASYAPDQVTGTMLMHFRSSDLATIKGTDASGTTAHDGVTTATVSFQALGGDGSKKKNIGLRPTSNSATAVLTPSSTVTDGSGNLRVTITNTVAETVTVTMTSNDRPDISGTAKAIFV